MDYELFTLCKEVSGIFPITDEIDYYVRLYKPYKLVVKVNRWQWDDDTGRFRGKPESKRFHEENEVAPLYTSDYLLEKLPATVENTDYNSGGIDRSRRIALQLRKWDRFQNGGLVYFAEYHEVYHSPLFRAEADTPLKALLKLIIALDEAGVKL